MIRSISTTPIAILSALLAGGALAGDVVIDMPPMPTPKAETGGAAHDASDYEGGTDPGLLALDRYAYARKRAYPTRFEPEPLVFRYSNAPVGYGYGGYGYGGYGYGGYGAFGYGGLGYPFFFRGHHHGHPW